MNAIKVILDGSKTIDEHDLRREEIERKDLQHQSTLEAKDAQDRRKTKSQPKSRANG
jgi:hypothetical protein